LPSTNNNKIAIEWNWMTTFPGNDCDGPQQLLPTMKMNSIFSIDYSILYSSSCLFLLSAFFSFFCIYFFFDPLYVHLNKSTEMISFFYNSAYQVERNR
jgi:hypothetical protein